MSVAGVKRKQSAKQKPKKKLKREEFKVVREDELQWKEVALPDHLEDAEGFFGLEELDDVEVVRNEGDHRVQFRVCQMPSFLFLN